MIHMASPVIGSEEKKLINEVLKSRIIASGKYVTEFEAKFAKYSGAKFGVACANGTVSLHASLLACGIKAGDKVATTPFSFIASANSILHAGCRPVFADIDPETYNICPESLEKILKKEKNIKAVLIVHLYGLMCDMDAILKLKKKYKFKLIEDCAQAHGAEYKGKRAGSFGDASSFSFYATKNAMTGEGGVILTNDAKILETLKMVVNHGRSSHSVHEILGYNYRLTNLAAAIGIAQIDKLEKRTNQRISNASAYNEAFKNLNFLQTPVIPKNARHVFHQYTLRIKPTIRQKFI
ncbi:MAG: DegT/DnrJ/EryC1/StrS family aminotransferase, partial [Elusimicrobia bacterium]|nr:DegT/DnrJ/EryC1/StrS family aminotransferase [Elusimicrobiota bacterium]